MERRLPGVVALAEILDERTGEPLMESRVLQVASSFTSVPIAGSLRPLVVAAGIADDLGFAQYSQMTEYMLGSGPDSPRIVGTVVLARAEDWLRDELKSVTGSVPDVVAKARQILRANVDEFGGHMASLAGRGKPVWFLACPSTGWIAEWHKLEILCRTFTNLLVTRIRSVPGVMSLAWPTTSLPDANEFNDRNTDRLGQIPFSQDGFARLGQFLAEVIEQSFVGNNAGGAAAQAGGASGLAEYLAGLKVRVRMSTAKAEDRSHVDRILRTAAALSLRGENRDLADAEVDALMQSGKCMVIRVSDRLANHGVGGVVAFETAEDSLVVEAMALSCPVLGKQAEYAVVLGLARIATERKCKNVVFDYRPAGRNQFMSAFLKSVSEEESQTRFVLPVGEAEDRVAKAAIAAGTWILELGT